MAIKLRDFIRNIRSCKTAAEERAVIAKECALIRTAFKEGDPSYRHRNVAKLLFIHMMGYPTHFGQLECLKLIASPRFVEKRVGYLGLTQMMDENTEILMLVINSIKNDLHHPCQYIIGLALCAVGNIASPEMCRALAKEVEDLCSSSNPYVRKKALLCAIRLVRKVEDITERFLPVLPAVFEERNHGVLLSGCGLVEAIMEVKPSKELQKLVPQLVFCLQRVVFTSGYSTSTEYDVSGVTDPFLQVKLLRLMRLLYESSFSPIDEFSDLLTQMCSTTESSKGSGNAVLLECATTIMAVSPDSSLKALGVSILAKFLQNKDNNIRYVALSSLQQLVKLDVVAVQKHRSTIIECLNDTDSSIRRRSLEILFHLVNEDTLKQLFKEMLRLLVGVSDTATKEDADFRKEIVSKRQFARQMCSAIDSYSSSRRWQIDSLIRILSLAGESAPFDVRNSFVSLLSLTPQLQSYAVLKLFFAAKENFHQDLLLQVAIWAVGEYGDLLVAGKDVASDGILIRVDPPVVMDFLESCVNREISDLSGQTLIALDARTSTPHTSGARRTSGFLIGSNNLLENSGLASKPTMEFLLTTLIKLSTRFTTEKDRIQALLKRFDDCLLVELQQRACEYQSILSQTWDDYREGLLDKMPQIDTSIREVIEKRPIGDSTIDEVLPVVLSTSEPSGKTSVSNDLLDLDDLLDSSNMQSSGGTPQVLTSPTNAVGVTTKSDIEDLLDDLFGATKDMNAIIVNGTQPKVSTLPATHIDSDSLL